MPADKKPQKDTKWVKVNLNVQNKIILNPEEPIPITYNGDSFRYARDKKYIPFLGMDDNLPNLLLEARLTSASQNSCISSIAQALIGKGIAVKDNDKPNPDWVKWLESINNKKQPFNKALIGIVDGERTHGNQFIEVVRVQVGKERFLKVYPKSMLFCRLASPVDLTKSDQSEGVVISKLISKNGYVNLPKNVTQIPLWSPDKADQKKCWLPDPDVKGVERTMLHFKNEISSVEHYGLPASIAGLRYQILEGKAAQFNIDNFDNNMILGGMLILKSGMTKEEAEAQAEEIMMSHIGVGKTGRIAVIASEQGLQDVEFVPFNTQKEGSYIEFDKRIEEKIISCNGWDSVLAGINRSSTFGNGSQYIRSIWDVKDAVLLHPLRKKLIDEVIKPIMQIYAEWFEVTDMLKYEYNLQTNMPFSFMGELDPNSFFMVDEARHKAGLTPDPDTTRGKKFLAELGSKTISQRNVQATGETTQSGAVG